MPKQRFAHISLLLFIGIEFYIWNLIRTVVLQLRRVEKFTMNATKDLRFEFSKSIGIILVVYGHAARGVHAAGIKMDEHLYQLVDNIIYSFHMPLFFTLSGLFFFESFEKRQKIGLIVNKVDTLIYPYIVWSLLQGGIELVLSKFTNGNVTPIEIFSLFWEPRAQFWFLYILFLIFVLAVFIYRKNSAPSLSGICTAALIAQFLTIFVPDIFPIRYIGHYFVYFAFGVVLKKFVSLFSQYPVASTITSGAVALCLQYCFHAVFHAKNNFVQPFNAIFSILFVIAVSEWLSRIKQLRGLALLGTFSFHIYLMHILLGSGVRIVLNKFLDISNPTIHIVAGSLVGLLLPVFFVSKLGFATNMYLFSPPRFLSAQKKICAHLKK